MRSDDAVETIKRHAEYESSTGEESAEQDEHQYSAVPELVRRKKGVVFHCEIRAETLNVE